MKDKLDPGKWLMRLVSPRGGASPPLESVGRALQRFVEACGGEAHPDGIFECSLRFLFRVAFLAHFSSALGERPCPREAPLRAAFLDIARRAAAGPPPGREGESGLWESLLKLFRAAGRGGGAAPAPLGGIFSPAQATLLEKHGLFRDGALCAVLSAVLAGPDGSPLDFASVPLPLLGSLHQKLTDYGFRTAEEDLELAPAGPGRAKGEPARRIAKGELYLLRLPRNRKTGGAYYTPESLAGHLAGKGVGRLLDTVFRKPPSTEYKTTERGESRENAEGAEGARGTRAPQGTQAAPGPRIARPGEITAPVRTAHDGEEAPLPSLLEMRILDSSCGSGGLLVAALGALADEALERLESDGPLKKAVEEETRAVLANLAAAAAEPAAAAAEGSAPEGYAASDRESRDLRRVIVKRVLLRRAIHGVDLSSFAVELARHALRMEAFIPGTPLPFLEHRIRLGNSLIGQGPGAAARLSGESGEARAFRRRLSRLREIASAVSDLDDGTFAGAAAAERLFRKKAEPLRRRLDSLLDSLTGEDLLEAGKDGAARGKADGAARDGEPGPGAARPRPGAGFSGGEASPGRPRRQAGPGGAGVHAAARGNPAEDPSDGPRRDFRRLRRAYGLFNWEAEFPEAFAGGRPGFDLIVANPPWERSRFEDPLFFSQFSPSYRALPESGKAGLRAGLLAREAVNSLRAEGAQRARTESRYFMRAYPKSRCGGDGNLCRFFAERDLSLLAPRGILSLAAPAALMMDDGSADLRRHVFGNFTLRRCEGFVNARGVFPDVHAGFKFALLQIENARDPAQAALARFRLTDPGDLATDDGAFAYPLKDVRLTSPGRLAYLEMADGGRELPALKRIFRALPPLGSGWLDFRRELDATEDKSVFREERGEGLIPLYKGEMLWQFDARYAEARQWVDPGELEKYLLRRNLRRLAEDLRVQALASPEAEGILRGACGDGNSGLTRRRILRYLADTAGGAFPVPDHSFARLCFRAIAADTNERSMVAALIPPEVAVQNSAWVSVPGRYSLDTRTGEIRHAAASLERLLFALGLFNSLPFDWLLRFSVNMNVNKTFVTRIPFPPASDREIRENPRYRSLARNAAVLTLSNTPDLFPEARALYGLSGRERALGEEEYGALKASGDVAAAEIYGLTAKDVEVMLKGFKVLAENRPGYVAEIRRQSRERLPAG